MYRSIRITLRRQLRRQTCCASALLLILCVAGFAQTKSDSAADQAEARILADFGDRIRKYLEARQNAGGAPKPAKEPEKLVDHRKQTAAKLRVERTDAKRGDIFTPEIAGYFRRQITATFTGPEGPKIRASLRRAEPVRGIVLKVNAAYPATLPLQSTPPTLLLNLPRLPKDLEYRIVGRDLALHDTVTNLIVDFIPNAIPAS
jgi:hypothetical protein